MTSFFPDVNVWLALADPAHTHSTPAWAWLDSLPSGSRLVLSRFTQLAILRLLTNHSVMGPATLTLSQAWTVLDRWSADPRVEFRSEPRGLDETFRRLLAPLASKPAPQWVGDCYLLAFAAQSHAALVTFDEVLHKFARKSGHPAVLPT